MTEDHAPYNPDRPDQPTREPERLGDILSRLAEQQNWTPPLPPNRANRKSDTDPLTNGRRHA